MLDVVNEDYVRTAEAKGLLRARRSPAATSCATRCCRSSRSSGSSSGCCSSGAILTETVFAFNGVGKFVADAIRFRDYSVIQGFILVFAVIYVLVNLLVDIVYGLIDPRVRVR